MASIELKNEIFDCHQTDEIAIITVVQGAHKLLSTVGAKDILIELFDNIQKSGDVKGLVIIYSSIYPGNEEYIAFVSEVFKEAPGADKARYTVTFKNAIKQMIKVLRNYPLPILVGMDGDIGPVSSGLSLFCDRRISTEQTKFFNPSIEIGLPPSALFSFHLSKNLGYIKATELLLSQSEFNAKELFNLGLVSSIVPEANFEDKCLDEIRKIIGIPRHTLIETRNILQPDLKEISDFIDRSFDSSLRCYYKLHY